MPSFFSSAFQGFASLFSSAQSAPPPPVALSSATSGEIATSETFSEMAAGIAPYAEGAETFGVTQAVAAPPAPAINPSWFKLALAVLDVALTKPGQDRRRDAVRRAVGSLGTGAIMLAVALGAAAPTPAAAEGDQCGARDRIVERLRSKYGESQRGAGILQGQRVVEVWASDDSGSWTIVVTLPDGSTCLLAAGEDWTPVEAPAPVSGRGA